MSEMKKCAHGSCQCMTTEKYCSQICKDAAHVTDLTCQCGHDDCKSKSM